MARDERRDPGEMYPGGKTYGKPGEAPDRAVSWKSVVDKPTTYPPEKHRHDTSEVDGLNDSLEQFVRKVEGKGLSTCDYTQAEKKKLSGVEDGANKTIIDASLSTSSAAADAKAVGDKIADCMTKVTTLKINDEWRFSVGPGISGEMAIRLEHLEFPSQGIWGIYTAMTIPTGLGTLAKFADVPKISTTFTSADAGKAADAKAVGEALEGKATAEYSIVRVGKRKVEALDVFDEVPYDANEKAWNVSLYGNVLFKVLHLEGKTYRITTITSQSTITSDFTIQDKEGYFLLPGTSNSVVYEVRNAALCAKSLSSQAVAVATQLTPVLDADGHVTGYKLGDKASPVLLTDDAKAALFAGAAFREAAFGKAATSAANLESGNVAVVDGSAGGTVMVSFKANAPGDSSLRYCELLVTGVTADDAVTISLPAGTYQFADGADKTSKGNNHFVFAEYSGGWMVNKTVRTEATITEG